MANDNRKRPPHGHDPEQARREAARAQEARRKLLVLHPVIPVHIPLGLAGMTSAKNPDITRYAVRKCFLQLAGS